MATTKTGKSTSAASNKTQFVKSLPSTMSAKEVIARAKARGMTISQAYVYSIRTAAKAKARPGGGRGPRVALANGRGAHGAEDLLRAIAAEIGLARAIALLEEERQKVRAVMRA